MDTFQSGVLHGLADAIIPIEALATPRPGQRLLEETASLRSRLSAAEKVVEAAEQLDIYRGCRGEREAYQILAEALAAYNATGEAKL